MRWFLHTRWWLRTRMESDGAGAGYVVQSFVAWRTWNDVDDEELAMVRFADAFYRTLAAAHIVEEVRKQVRCLLDHDPDHVYADLKVANVLFKKARGGKKMEIGVGDLGSMSRVRRPGVQQPRRRLALLRRTVRHDVPVYAER